MRGKNKYGGREGVAGVTVDEELIGEGREGEGEERKLDKEGKTDGREEGMV